jgi:predicted RNA binding protein YcfA (HicA-like mRNA interferase family)
LARCSNEAGITSYWDWSMPRKIRELVRDLKKAGWCQVSGGKGDHRKFKHDKARIFVIIPDADHKDAKPYLEKQIRKAIDESSR